MPHNWKGDAGGAASIKQGLAKAVKAVHQPHTINNSHLEGGKLKMANKNTKRTSKRAARKRGAAEPTEYTEHGHEVLDLVAASQNDKRAANQLLAVMQSEIVPRWVREALANALAQGAQRKGSPLLAPVLKDGKVIAVSNGNPFFQNPRKNLETLIGITPGNFTLRLSERAQLAHAISTILNSKEAPANFHNSVGDFVTDICTPLMDGSPEMIEKGLALVKGVGHASN